MNRQTGRNRRLIPVLAAAALCLCSPAAAYAEGAPLTCVLEAEDVGNGYQYSIPGIGGFSVNCTDGETVSAAVVTLEEGCEARLYRNGYEMDFGDGILFDKGAYELQIFRRENPDGDYGQFHITVENSYGELFDREYSELRLTRNPEMELDVDGETSMYQYTLPDGTYIRCDVPQGGQSGTAARMELSEKLNLYRVLRDGEPVEAPQGLLFDRPGSYQVTVWDNELGLDGPDAYRVDYCFTLYGQGGRSISYINAPMGFYTEQVIRDGQILKNDSGNSVHLESDGSYELRFAQKGGDARWTMKFKRDTTPPCLNFLQELNPDEVIREEVSYIPSEAGTRIRVYRNGQLVETMDNRIAVDGAYQIVVSDAAGNEREYRFVLREGFDVITKEWMIIPLVLLAAAAGCIVYWRRTMRVL